MISQKLPSDCLPHRSLYPELKFDIPALQYPPRLNACRELLDANLDAGRGGRTAIYYRDGTLSYDDLSQSVQTLAAALRELGLVPGDRVVVRFQNRPEFIISWLAVLRVGGIVVATMPLLRARELGAIVADSNPVFFLTQEELWDEAATVVSERQACTVVLTGAPRQGCISWADLVAHPKGCPPADTSAEDVALLAYTSGSTGEPKG